MTVRQLKIFELNGLLLATNLQHKDVTDLLRDYLKEYDKQIPPEPSTMQFAPKRFESFAHSRIEGVTFKFIKLDAI